MMDVDELTKRLGDALKGAGPLCDNLSCASWKLSEDGSPGWAQAVTEAHDMIRTIALLYHEATRP